MGEDQMFDEVVELERERDQLEALLHEVELTVFSINGEVKVPREEIVKWMCRNESAWNGFCCEAREKGRAEGAAEVVALREACSTALGEIRTERGDQPDLARKLRDALAVPSPAAQRVEAVLEAAEMQRVIEDADASEGAIDLYVEACKRTSQAARAMKGGQ